MSESTPSVEPVTVGRDGLTVTKSLLLDEFPVPTVELELRSARTDRTSVRLREYVPDGYSLESIGFHGDYGSEHWTAYQDNRIEFEREIGPNETVRTIYGLRVTEDEEIAAFMGEPELVTVSGLGEETETAGVVDRDRNDALRSMLGGSEDGEGADEPDEPAAAEASEAPPADQPEASKPDPAAPAESTSEAESDDIDMDEGDDAGAPPAMPGSVAEALAEELAAGEVDDDTREAIREALGLDLSRSTEAQLDHLQARVEDLFAYSEPVVAFIDDEGPTRLAELEASADALESTVADLEADIATIDADYDGAIAELDAAIDDLDDRLNQFDDRFDEADAALEDLVQWRNQLGEMFTGREE